MKRVLITLPVLLLSVFFIYKQFFLKPEIGQFKLLDSPWPAYCDFYKNEVDQSAGQAIFAFPSKEFGQTYVANIDGGMQSFKYISETWKERDYQWLVHGNDKYSIFLKITDHSDVEDIKRYSGSMRVNRNSSSKTIDVIGRCGT